MTRYYSTSHLMTMEDFIEVEVNERRNYPLADVKKWMKKYNLKPMSEVIWVAKTKWMAWRYQENAEDWDNIPELKRRAKKHNADISVYSTTKGRIIPESDDGDDGYLFICEGN